MPGKGKSKGAVISRQNSGDYYLYLPNSYFSLSMGSGGGWGAGLLLSSCPRSAMYLARLLMEGKVVVPAIPRGGGEVHPRVWVCVWAGGGWGGGGIGGDTQMIFFGVLGKHATFFGCMSFSRYYGVTSKTDCFLEYIRNCYFCATVQ